MDDRRVHASLHGRWEIVRYDRGGKWYSEMPCRRGIPRIHIGVAAAAQKALEIERAGGEVFLRVPGGSAFDRHVTRIRATEGGAP